MRRVSNRSLVMAFFLTARLPGFRDHLTMLVETFRLPRRQRHLPRRRSRQPRRPEHTSGRQPRASLSRCPQASPGTGFFWRPQERWRWEG